MIIRHFKTIKNLQYRNRQKFGSATKFFEYIRMFLNRLANQEKRTFIKDRHEDIDSRQAALQEIGQKIPQNALQAESSYQKHQKIVSNLEEGRLQRIDDILGTKTYFHQTKLYQQRLDSEHVMNISRLQKKFRQAPRQDINYTNPQVKPVPIFRNQKKHVKMLQRIKQYPSGYPQLTKLVQNPQKQDQNRSLIKMLSEQTIYSNLSLSDVDLVIKSIQKQKIYLQKQNDLIQAEYDHEPLTKNGYTYFQPIYSDTLFRIPTSNYTHKLRDSYTKLQQITQESKNLQQILSIQQVYECIKDFYYDERISHFLKRIENNQLDYFISDIHSSQNGKHLVIVIDLLGTKKQYIGLYKYVGTRQIQAKPLIKNNIIFNIKPDIHLQNDATAYYIQRSQEGMFIELVKTEFFYQYSGDTSAINSQQSNNPLVDKNYKSQIIYRSQPYKSLTILTDKLAKLQNTHQNNKIVLFQESDANNPKINNKIFAFNHSQIKNNNKNIFDVLQQITSNTWDKRFLQKIYGKFPLHLQQKYSQFVQEQHKIKFYHQCHEVHGLGFILIRYLYNDSKYGGQFDKQKQLRYCFNDQIAHFATIIPYEDIDLGLSPQESQSQMYTKNSITKLQNSIVDVQLQQVKTQKLTDILKFSSNQLVIPPNISTSKSRKLAINLQQIIFTCKQQQYFNSFNLQHLSQNNIYLIMSMSLQSIYNNNFMHVHPLRAGIKPYSLYLDGYSLKIQADKKTQKILINAETPILSSKFQYNIWNKQLKQVINQRIYTEKLTLQFDGNQIEIKILSLDKFINPDKSNDNLTEKFVVLYVPSSKKDKLNDLVVRKMLQKGIIFIQMVKGPGCFGSDMIELMRGTKKLHINHAQALTNIITFIKTNISDNIGLYAKGAPACYSSLLINVLDNQDGNLIDGTILHQGIYDLSNIPNTYTKNYDYFFGEEKQFWKKRNPLNFRLFNPKKTNAQMQQQNGQHQQSEQQQDIHQQLLKQDGVQFSKLTVTNLHNIIFSSSSLDQRQENRKYIRKVRLQRNFFYDEVYLKQYLSSYQCDLFNLAFLYTNMKKKAEISYLKQKNLRNQQLNDQLRNEYENPERKKGNY